MGLKYLKEHITCTNYVKEQWSCNHYNPTIKTDFHIISLDKNESYTLKNIEINLLCFFIKGKADVTKNYQKFVANEGEIVFAQISSDINIVAKEPLKVLAVYLDTPFELCEKQTFESLTNIKIKRVLNKLPIVPYMRKSLDLMVELIDEGARCKHLFDIKRQELLFLFRFFYSKDNLAAFFAPIVSEDMMFKSLVLANYKQVNTIKDLADKCMCSSSKFGKKFHESFGEDPQTWMTRQKVELILFHLRDSNSVILDVAYKLGFSSQSHFTTFCKRNIGKTPLQIKKEFLEDK